MDQAFRIGLHIAAFAALIRGLAAFDGGASAANNYPVASAILFVGGLAILVQLRRQPSSGS